MTVTQPRDLPQSAAVDFCATFIIRGLTTQLANCLDQSKKAHLRGPISTCCWTVLLLTALNLSMLLNMMPLLILLIMMGTVARKAMQLLQLCNLGIDVTHLVEQITRLSYTNCGREDKLIALTRAKRRT